MKVLILSDIHLGDPRFKQDYALHKLLKKEYDLVVLNGDIIDSWLDWEGAACCSYFIKEIDCLKNVVWVRGNHDPEASIINKILPIVKVVESFQTEQYFFIHGHQVYWHENKTLYDRLTTRLNAWLYSWFGINCQKWLVSTKYYQNKVTKKRQLVLDKYGASGKIIIMGHTHVPVKQTDGEKVLYDGGSVLGGSYLEISDGVSFKQI